MSYVDEKVIELVRAALGLEMGGAHFYQHIAGLTQNPSGKAMFERLAEEERAHVEETHALFAALIGEEEWRQLYEQERGEAHPSKLVDELEATIAQRGHAVVADDTQALRMAMELERKALHLFEAMAGHTQDPVLASLIGKIIDQERYHYDSLQAQLDSILNVGIWLDKPEFRMDGKF